MEIFLKAPNWKVPKFKDIKDAQSIFVKTSSLETGLNFLCEEYA